jgi:hypothetical protein
LIFPTFASGINVQSTAAPAEGKIMLFLFYPLLGSIFYNYLYQYEDFSSVLLCAGCGLAC